MYLIYLVSQEVINHFLIQYANLESKIDGVLYTCWSAEDRHCSPFFPCPLSKVQQRVGVLTQLLLPLW